MDRELSTWERPMLAAVRVLPAWAPVRATLTAGAAPARPSGPSGRSGPAGDLAAEVVRLLTGVVGKPDRRTGLLLAFMAKELAGRLAQGNPGRPRITVRPAAEGGLNLLHHTGDRNLRLTLTPGRCGPPDPAAHLAALGDVLSSLLPLSNNDSVRFDVGTAEHGLALDPADPAADALVRAWWPGSAIGAPFAGEDLLRLEDLGPVRAQVERENAALAGAFGHDGWDAEAPPGADPEDQLAVWLGRDLFAVTEAWAGRPYLAYDLGLPPDLAYAADDAAGAVLLVGPARAVVLELDAVL